VWPKKKPVGKNSHAVKSSKLAGKIWDKKNTDKISSEKRSEIAKKAAKKRWPIN